jgi:hypothetical protein
VERTGEIVNLGKAKVVEAFSDEAALVDSTVVATNKVKNGIKSFGEFSTQMVKEFGESIRPELRKAFDKAVDNVFGGRRDIDLQELLGGHTIEKHVGKTEKCLGMAT